MNHLPEEYLKKLRKLLGTEYPDYLAGYQKEYGQTLRVNRLKTEPADLIRRFILREGENEGGKPDESSPLFEPVPWCPEGFYYHGKRRLSKEAFYHAGLYYLQEPSAMAPAAFLPAEPGDRVLDLCAAPGGKSTALAGKLQGRGLLLANDVSASRCQALLKNLEMAGVHNMIVSCETPERLRNRLAGTFDKVLVDAPCSGEGMFRKEPAMGSNWTESEVERYQSIQKQITECAAELLKPGGYLLYSTCTYSPEEDEQVVYDLLKKYPDLEMVPLMGGHEIAGIDRGHPEWISDESGSPDEKIAGELTGCLRFWFHRVSGEGQFLALMRKKEETLEKEAGTVSGKGNRKKSGRSTDKGSESPEQIFLKDCNLKRMFPDGSRIEEIDGRLYLLPEDFPSMRGLRVIRSGLYLGEKKKKRFEPSQALAMALRPGEYPRVVSLGIDDPRAIKYLKGETIPVDGMEGWALVCLENYPLGWGKASRGLLKNKIQPGWRLQ